MGKKFLIRGYKEKVNFPILYDDGTHSLEEARAKAKEYFGKIGPLSKVIIFEQEEGGKEKAAKFICKSKAGKLEEIGDWWETRKKGNT